jgi:putative PIG3 family NAD(P)H quinone oxidoreductase
MIAIQVREPGPPDVLEAVDRPTPVVGAGEVLIRVGAAGVNRPDVMQRLGQYPPPPGVTDIPGLEIAGTIAAVADEVSEWRVGDGVCALVSGGGYAEYCVAPAGQCLPIPAGMSLTQAAAIPETTFTVWTNVFERGRLMSGETLLVHGGSSGIGTTAIQLARARGARVLATAGTAEKCAACEALGAMQAFNYHEVDFVAAVKDATGGRGVDVILDMVAGEYVRRNLQTLAMEGRLVMIGRQGGGTSEIDVMTILRRRLTLTGSTLRQRSVAEKSALARAVREHVWPLFESGAMRVVVHATFPLRDAAEAHRVMESSAHIGKLVLTV